MVKDKSVAVCIAHIGSRSNYEDNFLVDGQYLKEVDQKEMESGKYICILGSEQNQICLYAVSDGLGGHNAGEKASLICVEKLSEAESYLQKCESLNEALSFLQKVISDINHSVNWQSCQSETFKDMGATLVILLIFNNEIAVLNIGDSRAYYYNKNSIVQITKDHTEGQRMLDLGLLTRKELSDFPARKNLNRYIGYYKNGYILEADQYQVAQNDGLIILCSDGISDFISETRISEILSVEKNLEKAGMSIVREAVASRGADNATILMVPLER